jgi:site-specific DNA-methyltransferase (adenine-specific)
MKELRLLNGDCLDKLKELDNNSIDSIVTDPPYGLSFMGKKWDYDVPSVEIWQECLRVLKPGGHLLAFAGSRTYHRMVVRIEDAGFDIRDQIMWIYGSGMPKASNLKPAHEPIVLARKKGNTNLNINDCRLEIGRWPTNVIMDEEAGIILDKQSGISKSSKRGSKYNKATEHTNTYTPAASDYRDDNTYDDEGGASRFFYCPKANKKDRDEGNIHPTVKPTDLMKYLIRLVTPKGGIVLDPFMGSGSTGKAAMLEGMWFVGIEREKEYYEIAKQRVVIPKVNQFIK